MNESDESDSRGEGMPSPRYARNSWDDPYPCKYDWPKECFVQCGGEGLVISIKTGGDSYTTAFFEAFPTDTFIRGQGKTIEEAEKKCWDKYQRGLECKGHEFERRGYKNGAGFCKHCNFFKSKAFEPLEKCVICGAGTYYSYDIDGNWYCKEHKKDMPEDKKTKLQLRFERAHITFEMLKERSRKKREVENVQE